MRNAHLHEILEAFTADAAGRLAAETAGGAEIPFELVEERGRRSPLYCYRPLTGDFIRERLGLLSTLPTYAPAARALAGLDGLEAYLQDRGELQIPVEARELADAALRSFLGVVFAERSEFGLDEARFAAAYEQLERTAYEGRCISTVVVALLGVGLDQSTAELPLGEGLSLVRGDAYPDAPAQAVWGGTGVSGTGEPNVLAVLVSAHERSEPLPLAGACARLRGLLTALRLFERGGYALGTLGWSRVDDGAWRPLPVGGSGRTRFVTLISRNHEDELRAFCNLIARRAPATDELAWALARFEMGCERLAPLQALSDYLLALRALLEPEGPSSGRLAQRLSVICAAPAERAALAERTAHAISLERAIIAGLARAPGPAEALIDEISGHLRAILRDALCGHLDADLCAVADGLLAKSVRAAV